MDRKYLDHLSDMLAIKGRLNHRPSELSGGEQQRVAIARALITRPAIVLADEPTGNLDTKTSDAVLQMLLRSNKELGQTTLMITHNPEAAAIAGRILHMRDGQIVKEAAGSGLGRALTGFGAGCWGDALYKATFESLTPRCFLGIFERFARTPPVVCLNDSRHQGGVRKLSDQFD